MQQMRRQTTSQQNLLGQMLKTIEQVVRQQIESSISCKGNSQQEEFFYDDLYKSHHPIDLIWLTVKLGNREVTTAQIIQELLVDPLAYLSLLQETLRVEIKDSRSVDRIERLPFNSQFQFKTHFERVIERIVQYQGASFQFTNLAMMLHKIIQSTYNLKRKPDLKEDQLSSHRLSSDGTINYEKPSSAIQQNEEQKERPQPKIQICQPTHEDLVKEVNQVECQRIPKEEFDLSELSVSSSEERSDQALSQEQAIRNLQMDRVTPWSSCEVLQTILALKLKQKKAHPFFNFKKLFDFPLIVGRQGEIEQFKAISSYLKTRIKQRKNYMIYFQTLIHKPDFTTSQRNGVYCLKLKQTPVPLYFLVIAKNLKTDEQDLFLFYFNQMPPEYQSVETLAILYFSGESHNAYIQYRHKKIKSTSERELDRSIGYWKSHNFLSLMKPSIWTPKAKMFLNEDDNYESLTFKVQGSQNREKFRILMVRGLKEEN